MFVILSNLTNSNLSGKYLLPFFDFIISARYYTFMNNILKSVNIH